MRTNLTFLGRSGALAAVFGALFLASCQIPLQTSGGPGGLVLLFRLDGAPVSGRDAGGRLLLPSARTLRVNLVPQEAAQGAPIDRTVSIDPSQTTVPLPLRKVTEGSWTLTAEALSPAGTPLFRGTKRLSIPVSETVEVFLLPVAPPTVPNPSSGPFQGPAESLPPGGSLSWTLPSGAVAAGTSTFFVDGTGIMVYAQYADGGLAVQEPSGKVAGFGSPARPASNGILTLYNPTGAPVSCSIVLNPLTVAYRSVQGASGSPPLDPKGYLPSGSFTVQDAGGLSRPGYLFAGWNTQADRQGSLYQAGASVPLGASSVVLYDTWVPVKNTVAFSENGGTGSMAPVTVEYAATVSLTANAFLRSGYTFAGWNTAKDRSGTSYGDGVPFTMGLSSVVLYAQWTLVSYPLSYTLNGGTNGSGNPSAYTVTTPAITLAPAAKTGFRFGGWYDNADCTGTPVTQIPLGSTGARVLFAKWESSGGITVSLNNPTDQTVTFSAGTPVLNRRLSESVTVTADGGPYDTYRWTVSGAGTLPVLSGESTSSVTVAASPGTSIGTSTVTLWFGNGGTQYSKRFSLTVQDQ